MTIQLVTALSEQIRCVFIFDGASAPTAAEVFAGTASGGSSTQASPAAASATAGSQLNYLVTGLAQDTDYDVYCATQAGQLATVASLATSGYQTEPSVNTGGYAPGQITVALVPFNTETIRCGAMANGATAPTGAAIHGGSAGHQGTSPGAASKTGGSSGNVVLTGLTAATLYNIYCGTSHGVLSQVLNAYTSGYTSQPTKSSDTAGTTIGVTLTSSVTEQIKCLVVANGATAPSAAEVKAGTGAGGSGQLGVSSATSATALSAVQITIPSLTTATAYDCYCATVSGSVLSTKHDLFSSGFASQPAKNGDVAGAQLTVTLTITLAEQVRCVTLTNSATAPTAAQVLAGTGASASTPAGVNDLATPSANSAFTYTLSSFLTPATAYDVYCATASGTLSTKLDLYSSGFSVQPTATTVTGTTCIASFTVTLAESVRCVILLSGATAPTAANVNAGTGASSATPVHASSATSGNALSTTTINMASMAQAVNYDLYCATAAGTLATRVDFYSSGFTVQPTQSSLGPGISFVVILTSARQETVRCVALANGATAPTGTEVTAGTGASGASPLASISATAATALVSLSITVASLTAAVQYDLYCSTVANQLSTKLDIASSGYTVAPSLSDVQGTKLTVTLKSSAAENTRCVGITDGGTAPSSVQILAGTDAAGEDGAKTTTVSCNGGGSATCTLAMEGLAASTAHDVYCTTNGGVISSKLDVSTLGDTDCDSLGSCSGHGTCANNVCTCQDGYGSVSDIMVFKSPRCDQRACPAGRSWADVPTRSNAGHARAECSDSGICNRDNGQCQCFDGYGGRACERTTCKDDCSGHGRCVSMREAATMDHAMPLLCYPTKYEGDEV